MTLIAYLFLRLRPGKVVVRYMCKKSGFKLPCQKEHGKRVSTLFKSDRQYLRHIYCSTGRQLSCKKSLLVICQRLRLFLNTMSAVEKCSLSNRDNLMQPIHMELSEKLKTFSEFFREFSKSGLKFEHFEKKDDPHSSFISEARPAKIVVRYMCEKSRFRLPFQKEHGKLVSTLLKFERQHLYHIY